ncbi:MAG TPA: hypothetical protein VII72_08975 [Myxococcota bacterium]|jgi:hypothetical protein
MRLRQPALTLLFALCLGADDCDTPDGRVNEPAPGPFAAEGARYLPLEVGRRWVLRSQRVDAPVRVEVMRREGDAFVLEFENPWSFHEYRVVERGGRIQRLDRDAGAPKADGPALLFDFSASQGTRWSNALGSMELADRNAAVDTSAGRIAGAVRIRQKNLAGDVLSWTFARDVGLVQFGEGDWAFQLDREASQLTGGSPSPAPPPPPAQARPPGGDRVLLGLAATLPANQPYTVRNRIARFETTLEAGVSFVYLSPKWDELEPRKGRYDFDEVDFWVAQARRHGVPIVLNLRIVDTGQLPRPSDLRGDDWDEPELRGRLLALIDALVPRLEGSVSWFLVGNEISAYFGQRPGEAHAYTELWKAAAVRIRALVPGARVSASVTFDGLDVLRGPLRELDEAIDYLALTYYPLRSDFTMRLPRDVPSDFAAIERAAGNRKILLQEVGYSSSPVNRSSPEQQAEFYSLVFDQLGQRSSRIAAANFLWMSDLSDELVEEFGRYYKLPNVAAFKAYLKYLGLFDDRDRPKPAWEVFRSRGPALGR